jgi:hypothetical protein
MTSTELDRIHQESSLEVLPPAQPPNKAALAVLREHAEAMSVAHQFASAICFTQVCPTRFRGKPDDGAAAILYGLELGLSPSAALQKVVVIHGMPSLEARTMVALLKPRGYKVRTVEQSDESVTVEGTDLDGETHTSTWTMARAIRAGYVPEIDERTGKYKTNANGKLIGNEKYLTDPQAMLKAKAQAEVCRDMAPDVLLGISYSREELESEYFDSPPAQAAVPARVSAPVTVQEIFGEETADTAEAAPQPEPAEPTPQREDPPAQPQPPTEPGQDDGNDQGQGAESSSGATPQADSGDQDPPKREKSKVRPALERRLFKLLAKGDVDNDNREDRITIYKALVDEGATPITSTDDLTDTEVALVCDQLFAWDKDGQLGQKITDILNTAALAEADAEATQPEGEK